MRNNIILPLDRPFLNRGSMDNLMIGLLDYCGAGHVVFMASDDAFESMPKFLDKNYVEGVSGYELKKLNEYAIMSVVGSITIKRRSYVENSAK